MADFTGEPPTDSYSANSPNPVVSSASRSCTIGLTHYFGSAGGGSDSPAVGTLSCAGVSGSITFAPALVLGGDTPDLEKVSLRISDCTTTASNYPTPTSGRGTSLGKLSTNDCSNLLTGATLKAASSTNRPYQQGDALPALHVSLPHRTYSAVHVNVAFGGKTESSDPDLGWRLGGVGTTVATSFTGSDAGSSSTAEYNSNMTTSQVASACASPAGIASVKIVNGTLTLQ